MAVEVFWKTVREPRVSTGGYRTRYGGLRATNCCAVTGLVEPLHGNLQRSAGLAEFGRDDFDYTDNAVLVYSSVLYSL